MSARSAKGASVTPRAGFAVAAVIGVLAGCATPAPAAPPVERVAPTAAPPAPTTAPAPAPTTAPALAPIIEQPPPGPVAPPVVPDAVPPPVAAPPASTPAPEPLPEPSAPPATEPTDEHQLVSVLSDLQRYGAMSADEVRREQNALTQLLARQRTDFNRIRLAVLYTLSKTPQDDQRAVQLLDTVASRSNPGSPAAKQLAAVMQVQVTERMRAVKDEQQKADAAVKKLDALRNMERDLLRDRIRSGGGGGGGGGSSGGGGGGGGG